MPLEYSSICVLACLFVCLMNDFLQRGGGLLRGGGGYALDLTRRSADASEAPVTVHSVPERSIWCPQRDTCETGRNVGLATEDLDPWVSEKGRQVQAET